MVGRLRTDLDRRKSNRAAAMRDRILNRQVLSPNFEAGQFWLRRREADGRSLRSRWLLSIHRPLASQELRQLKLPMKERPARLLSEATERLNRGNSRIPLVSSKTHLRIPHSSLIARANSGSRASSDRRWKHPEAKAELLSCSRDGPTTLNERRQISD